MFKKILLSFFFVANALLLLAQSHYPVQVQPVVISPSVYLQDYVDQNNFQVKVSLNDLSKQNFQIRLKMTISDNKTLLHTSNQGLVLTLNGGQVYYLSTDDLATLFDPADLGIAQNYTLKEGMYSFSFEATTVFDNTVKVSNISLDFTQALVVLNDPPLLNMPVKDSELDLTQIGSSIQFGWMPRSFFTSPNRQVKYAIKIVKVDPVETNPYQAIQSQGTNVMLDQDGIDAPFLIYDPSMFQLETGTVYAWQVRAYEEVVSGGIVTKFGARFKNDGYSEVQTFSTKDVCPSISIVAQPNTGANPVVLSWTTGAEGGTPTQYEVQYREQGTTLPYTIVRTSESSITLDNTQIQEGLTYEYNVAVLCKKWQAPVYGGTFKLQKPSCSPPSPIKIENPNVKGEMVLFWDLPVNQSLTAFKATINNGAYGDVVKDIPVVDGTMSYSVTLPVLTSGGYNVQIDGVCDQTNAPGKKQFVAYNDNGFIGACPLPTPLTLYATRHKGDSANITFTSNQLHQSYVLKYWELSKDSSTALTVNIPTALSETKLPNIADNVLYQYRITFVCTGGKTTKTGIGMFKIDPANNLDPNITPPTGNCFPPAQIAAEARSTTSAKFDWGKSTGADEYQLLYRVEGSTGNFQVFNTTASDAKLSGLQDGKIYEYKIKSRCGSAYSIESSLGTVDLSKPTSNANCDTLSFVRINKVTQTEIQLAWKFEAAPIRTGYTIFYKEDSQAWTDQYVEDFQDLSTFVTTNVSHDTAQFTLINLKPGTKYNFKIQAACGTDKAQANDVISGTTTPDPKPKGCESGKACDRTSNIPKTSLVVGDVIGVADYNVKITEVEPIAGSSPQKFKGNGIAEAPFIGMSENLAMNVSFDNLLVNDKMCTLKGDINLDSASLYILDEKTRNQVKTMVADAHQLAAQTQDVLSQADSLLQIANDAAQQAVDYAQGGGDVGKVKDGGFNEDYTTTTTPTAADAPTKPALVKNTTTGEVYQVDATGKVTKIGQYGTGYTDIEKKPITPVAGVTFKYNPNTSAKYPYDAFIDGYKKATMQSHYLKMGTTYCDAKLILPKELDKVDFTYSGDKSKLKFVNRKGFEFDYSGNTINLVGGPASDAQEIMAVYDDGTTKTVIGALLLASYEPKQKKVILVSTSLSSTMSASATQIQTELNKIYGPLGVNYTVTLDESFKTNIDWYSSPNQTTFDAGDNTNLGNKYTADAKEMIDKYIAFKTVDNLDKDAAYLFLVPPSTTPKSATEQLDGKMHFMQQFGFLFDTKSKSASTIALTLAHELGHGNYNIYHVFDDIYLGSSATQSNNLMAYGGGSTLNKLQWDQIHDPGVSWGLFVSDDDQNAQKVTSISYLKPLQNSNKTFTFLSPGGMPITILSTSLTSLEFYNEEEVAQQAAINVKVSRGTLKAFSFGNVRYVAIFNIADEKFLGYKDFAKNKIYTENYTKSEPSNGDVILGNTVIKDSKYYFRLFKAHYDANHWVYGLSGWPTNSDNNASGDLAGINFYNVDDDNYKKSTTKIDLLLSEVKYNAAKTEFLSLFNGLENPTIMLYVAQIGVKLNTNINYLNNYFLCHPTAKPSQSYNCDGEKFAKFIPTEQDYAFRGCLQNNLNGIYFNYLNKYRETMSTLQKDLISYHSGGLNRQLAATWKTNLWAIVNKSIINYSTLESHFENVLCLDQNYKDVYKSFTLVERKSLITHLLNDNRVNRVPETFEFAIINLLTTAKDKTEANDFLTLLENFKRKDNSSIGGMKYIWDSFDDVNGEDNLTAVIFSITSLINLAEKSSIDEAYLRNYMDGTSSNLPQLETNLLEFKNVDVSFNASNNNLMEVEDYANNSKYYELIPVRCASTFTISGEKYPIGKIMYVPAILLKLFSKENTMEVTGKSTMVALDIGMCFVGVGELKLLFTAGNWVRKAIVVAGTVADVTDITLNLLNEGVLSETTINRIQIATRLLNLPNLAANVPKVNKLIDDLDAKINLLKISNPTASRKIADARKLLFDKINAYYIAEIKKMLPLDMGQYVDEIASCVNSTTDYTTAVNKYKCFVAQTLVRLDNGFKKIEEVKEGDYVMSYNHKMNRLESKIVSGLKRSIAKGLLCLSLSTGQTIYATPTHPFYVNNSYKEASELHIGDTLFSADREIITVASKVVKDTTTIVYNFTVADNNNYFVSSTPVLVHNECLADLLKKYPSLTSKVDALTNLKANFMKDFADAPESTIKFLSETGGFEAWKMLDESPDIRLNLSNLENLKEVLNVKVYQTAGISDVALKSGINTSKSKAKMIESLKEASNEGGSVEEFLDAFAGAGREIDYKMTTPIASLSDEFPSINKSSSSSDVDKAFSSRQSATTKQAKIDASEALAEARVDQIYKSQGWTRLDEDGVPPGKQGKFDRIYVQKDVNGNILNLHVIEAKGGGSTLGSRVVTGDKVAQQGTTQYKDWTVDRLIKDLQGKGAKAEELRNALIFAKDETLIKYILVKQSATVKSDFIIKKF